jgi:hypothetical protein
MNQTTIPLDTIIGLCCTDGELNVPAGLLWRIPRLREAVLSAQPATIDDAIPSDVPSCLVQARRPTISIPAPFSVREWSELASHLVYGGKQTISAALLSLKNGLDLSADAMEFLEHHGRTGRVEDRRQDRSWLPVDPATRPGRTELALPQSAASRSPRRSQVEGGCCRVALATMRDRGRRQHVLQNRWTRKQDASSSIRRVARGHQLLHSRWGLG